MNIVKKPSELIKEAIKIFSESDEKEEIFECTKVVYLKCSNATLNLASNKV